MGRWKMSSVEFGYCKTNHINVGSLIFFCVGILKSFQFRPHALSVAVEAAQQEKHTRVS